MRWEEEVALLHEEMRRVLAFMTWHGDWWGAQACARSFPEDAMAEGVAAYAKKQAGLRFALRDNFTYLWRHAEGWIGSGKAPTARRWYHDVVIPRDAPMNVFNTL
jgi:hypothetical protein